MLPKKSGFQHLLSLERIHKGQLANRSTSRKNLLHKEIFAKQLSKEAALISFLKKKSLSRIQSHLFYPASFIIRFTLFPIKPAFNNVHSPISPTPKYSPFICFPKLASINSSDSNLTYPDSFINILFCFHLNLVYPFSMKSVIFLFRCHPTYPTIESSLHYCTDQVLL